MPPPRAAISSYVAPLLRSSNSSTRVPPKTGCVCASTKPGKTTRPSASTTSVSPSIRVSISSLLPTRSISPSRINIPPFAMMLSSRSSGPTRGRAGPASVTSCEQLTTASVLSLFSEDIEREADDIRYHDCADNFQSERLKIFHVRNRNDGVTDVDQSDDEAGGARNLQPPRRFDAQRFHPKQRNGKQDKVGQRVEDSARVVDQLKRFVRVHTSQAGETDHQRHCPHEYNRVDWRLVLRVQAAKPSRQQSIPARDHRQTRVADKINAHQRYRPDSDTENRDRSYRAYPAQ